MNFWSKRPAEKEKLKKSKSEGGFYKNANYMSLSAFETLQEEITNQMGDTRVFRTSSGEYQTPTRDPNAKMMRSHSMDSAKMNRYRSSIVEPERRALYGSLPFVAQFGMHNRELAIRNVLVEANMVKSSHGLPTGKLESTEKDLLQVDVDEILVTIPLMMASMVAIIAQFVQGINISIMNASSQVVFPGHSTTDWSIAVAAFAIGGPGGAMVGGYLTNKYGRRGALLIEIWIFLVGGILMSSAANTLWLIPARFIIGFASGISSVVVPVYLGEIAPPTLRGTLGTCTQFAMVIGILFADLLAFPLATPEYWRYLYSVTPMLCVLLLVISPFLLESPRWLLQRNEKSVYARVVIKKLRGFRLDEDVEKEAENFLYAAVKHKGDRDDTTTTGAYYDLWHDQTLHRLVISCVVLQMAQQLCGINAVFYYSTSFFEGIIDDALQGTALVAFINVLATYVALKLMDSTGRRTLLLLSSAGMILSAVFITVALLGIVQKSAALVAVMCFVSFFEIGLGPIPWLIVAEMFDAKYVATAMSISCVVNWGCNFLVGLFFPFIAENLGAFAFVPFGVVLVATFIFTLFYLPETQGRSVDEIHNMVKDMRDEVIRQSREEEEDGQGSTYTPVGAAFS